MASDKSNKRLKKTSKGSMRAIRSYIYTFWYIFEMEEHLLQCFILLQCGSSKKRKLAGTLTVTLKRS